MTAQKSNDSGIIEKSENLKCTNVLLTPENSNDIWVVLACKSGIVTFTWQDPRDASVYPKQQNSNSNNVLTSQNLHYHCCSHDKLPQNHFLL